MFEVLDFLNTIPYLPEVCTLLLAAKVLAGTIVNMTPTPKDDEWFAKGYKYIEFIAGIVTKKAKQ